MEAVTAGSAAGSRGGTGSKTIADLLPLAAKRYGDAPALRHKVGEEWRDISYSDFGQTAKEVALGLIDLGLEPGDKISILAHTRPEWSYACFGILTAGGTLVTIYQTNSPEECQYVLQHSDSRAVFVEDGVQLAKIREVEDQCPELEHVAARRDRFGLEGEGERPGLSALHPPSERLGGAEQRQVPRPEPRGHPTGAERLHAERPLRDQGEGQRSP